MSVDFIVFLIVFATVNQQISDLRGPGLLSRWVHWTNQTDDQRKRIATIDEILPILTSQQVRSLDSNLYLVKNHINPWLIPRKKGVLVPVLLIGKF